MPGAARRPGGFAPHWTSSGAAAPAALRLEGAGPARPALAPPPAAFRLPAWLMPLQLALAAIGVVLYSGAKFQLSGGAPEAEQLGASDPLNTLMQLMLLAGGGLAVLLHARRALGLALRLWPFLLIVAMIAASTLWSQSPGHTLRRSVSVVVLLLFVLSTIAGPGIVRFMRITVGVTLVLVVFSLAEAVLRPSIGFDTGDYANAVRGVFPQKNVFGMALLCGALALSYVVLERGRLRWSDGAILFVLLVMLVLARSTTSLLLTLLCAGATVAFLWLDRGGAWAATILLGVVTGGSAALLLFGALGTEGLFELIGKDASLTGRTFIWEEVWNSINQRPLLGIGYAAFWIADSPGVLAIQERVQWAVPSAHSGYLEVLLQLGWAGAVLVMLLAAVTLLWALVALARGPRRHAMWTLMLAGVLVILNQSESALLNPDLPMIFWLMVLVALQQAPPREAERPGWRRLGYVAGGGALSVAAPPAARR